MFVLVESTYDLTITAWGVILFFRISRFLLYTPAHVSCQCHCWLWSQCLLQTWQPEWEAMNFEETYLLSNLPQNWWLMSFQTWQPEWERPWILRKSTTYLTFLKIGGCFLFQVVIPYSKLGLSLAGKYLEPSRGQLWSTWLESKLPEMANQNKVDSCMKSLYDIWWFHIWIIFLGKTNKIHWYSL